MESGSHPKVEMINGRLTTRRAAILRGLGLALPGLLWVTAFLGLPLLAIVGVCWIGTTDF